MKRGLLGSTALIGVTVLSVGAANAAEAPGWMPAGNASATDIKASDEVRLRFSGGWGTVQMGDEDGAEDIMNYGGENLLGAIGGFDGDLIHTGGITFAGAGLGGTMAFDITTTGNTLNLAAPSYPTIAGDTSDRTKVSYFSPRFSGFQFGASLTPTLNDGDDLKLDGAWENQFGVGANYDNSFGAVRVRASAAYSGASDTKNQFEDVSAWSVGGIVGFGSFSIGANYTDNGDSGQPLVYDDINNFAATAPVETSYWNIAGSFETGPLYFSIGYFSSVAAIQGSQDSTYEHLALTADYTVAPGLDIYAEINLTSEEQLGGFADNSSRLGGIGGTPQTQGLIISNDATSLVLGANVSF